jgi:CheY-like chemotaxis protein
MRQVPFEGVDMATARTGSAANSNSNGVELHGLLLRLAPQWRERLPADVQFRRRLDARGHHLAANLADGEEFCAALLAAVPALPDLNGRLELSLIPVSLAPGESTALLGSGSWLRLNLRWGESTAAVAFDRLGNRLGGRLDASLAKLGAVASYSLLPFHVSQAFHFPVHWIDRERAILTPPGGYGRVLFVDDEPMVLDVHRQSMESLGYEVITAQSGLDALRLFRAAPHAFDLVLSDQSMPEMDGNQLALAIRDLDSRIPIVLCTGLATIGAQATADRAGVTAILEKPFTLEELAVLLRKALRQYRRQGAAD